MKKQIKPAKIGRATEIEEPTERTNLSLDVATRDKAKRIGDGNISRGVRLAVAKFKIKD